MNKRVEIVIDSTDSPYNYKCLECGNDIYFDEMPYWNNISGSYNCPYCGWKFVIAGDDIWTGDDEISIFYLEADE